MTIIKLKCWTYLAGDNAKTFANLPLLNFLLEFFCGAKVCGN
jgi:hypothetical protein